ncbi:MFS transporter, partial [Bacillus sp. PsM16]|uniref:MFS transporter n=1 Tax=Bacillus sp. PsM16 TaxID=3031172 RepID=UPI00263B6893
ISSQVLLNVTSKIERKRLYLISLLVFTLVNVFTYFSSTFALLMISRVLIAMSTALLVVLSLTITANLVEPAHRAK